MKGRELIESIKATAAEKWKYTRLDSISGREFAPASAKHGSDARGGDGLIVFHNGVFAGGGKSLPKGAEIYQISAMPTLHKILTDTALAAHPVAGRSLASTPCAMALTIKGKIAKPITITHTNSGDDVAAHPVLVIDIAAGAEAVIMETHDGKGSGLSMPVMAVRLGKGATLHHGRVQCEEMARHHLGATAFMLESGAQYDGISVQTGSAISRSENYFSLDGEEARAEFTTLYLARDAQLMDITSSIRHAAPSCTSMQMVRGVLDDKARGVFQGKVYVAQDAQHTDGNQMSRALLLSRECEADAKPELEIYADDVKCSHGATVGEIEEDYLFYLMSRGIRESEARRILIEAFLAEALDDFPHDDLREFGRGSVNRWLAAMNAEK